MTRRVVVKFGGESGQGINTLGKLLSKALKNSGFGTFAYREYPSLIKGGYASYQIDVCDMEISSSSRECDILAIFDEDSMHQYLTSVRENGIVLYDDKSIEFNQEEKEYIKDKKIRLEYVDTVNIAKENSGTDIMANMVMLGIIWKIYSLDIKVLAKVIREYFKKKKVDIEAEIKCLEGGYNYKTTVDVNIENPFKKKITNWSKSKIISGNEAIALGAIAAGCRAYYAYPMTPATSILEFLGNSYKDTGILVKQAEDEITAVQMAMGSMYMGARAMTATSGGGFDLMVETLSCSGISENPLVVVLSQRGGPGTGVPTWTGAGDLNTAVKSGHGEFPRCVMSVSDAKDGYELTQEAFNIAERYQLPVIILTEKHIAESLFNIKTLPKPQKVKRTFKEGNLRYQLTENGVSPRWQPKKSSKPYLSSSDEHNQDGSSTDEAQPVTNMMEKRLRKLQTLEHNLPEPVYYGSTYPDIVFTGFGSVKNTILDAMEMSEKKIGYLHYEYIYPLKTEKMIELFEDGARIIAVENNQTGEFSNLVREVSGFEISEKLLKFDGRPFFVEDILDFINE